MAPGLKGAARGSHAFRSWDEDAVTMAVEAARDCLRGVDAGSFAALHVAPTSFPYADLQNGAIVGEALRLQAAIRPTALWGSHWHRPAAEVALVGPAAPALLATARNRGVE